MARMGIDMTKTNANFKFDEISNAMAANMAQPKMRAPLGVAWEEGECESEMNVFYFDRDLTCNFSCRRLARREARPRLIARPRRMARGRRPEIFSRIAKRRPSAVIANKLRPMTQCFPLLMAKFKIVVKSIRWRAYEPLAHNIVTDSGGFKGGSRGRASPHLGPKIIIFLKKG